MLRFAGPVLLTLCVPFSLMALARADEPATPVTPLPTHREAKILKALGEPTAVDFAEQPLHDVVEFLKQKHEIDIQLDNKALTDAGIGSDTPVTRSLQGISLRSLLRLILTEFDLTYLVCDGYLLITSKTEAESMLRVRVYPVADLVRTDSEFRPPLASGLRPEVDFQNLIDLIASCTSPTTWDEVGGPGSIKGHHKSQSLTVSQTQEVQEEIADLLAALRRVRDKQLDAAKPVDPFGQKQEAREENQGPFALRVHRLVAAPQPMRAPAAAPPQAANAAQNKDATPADPAEVADAQERLEQKLEGWAEAIADVVPEMIEPESWQPAGPGRIRAVGNTLVVWHNDDVQYRVAKFINELLPGNSPQRGPTYHRAVRLAMPPVRMRWPDEAEPVPSGAEARICNALEELCELDLAEEPLQNVVDLLTQQHEIRIQLDTKALTDAGVGSDTPITRRLRGITLGAALKLILGELDLTYVIRNEVLLITSKTEAESMLTTKVYPVFDLVVRPPDGSPRVPGLDFASLIDNITSNLVPTTWDEVGGPGAIKPFDNAGALVISQTTEAHEEIAEYLKALRDVARKVKQDPGVVMRAAAAAD